LVKKQAKTPRLHLKNTEKAQIPQKSLQIKRKISRRAVQKNKENWSMNYRLCSLGSVAL
jgi:hypothetical protein